jgi:uncharacterized phage protein gp47/JayE
MALTLAQLLTTTTQAEYVTLLLAELAARGFPTTDWAVGGPERHMVESFAEIMADFTGPFGLQVAQGGFLEEATEEWLTLLARSNYNTTRKEATFATWEVTLEDTGNGGPYTVLPGQLWGASPAGQLFSNTDGGELALGGTLTLTFKAESPGTAHNAGPVSVLKTPLPGVEISASSLSSSAVDEESDEELRERAALQWADLAIGAVADSYKKWALDADVDVRRVQVEEDIPNPGGVRVSLARTDGTAEASDVTAVAAYIEERRPLTVDVTVQAAEEVEVDVDATVRIRASYLAAAQARVSGDLLVLLRGLAIGPETLFRAEIIEVLMALPGARNTVLTTPAADVVLTAGQVAKLGTVNITWQTF